MTKMLKDGLNPQQITEKLLEGLGTGGEGFSLKPRYIYFFCNGQCIPLERVAHI
jgi:hypothetical protein